MIKILISITANIEIRMLNNFTKALSEQLQTDKISIDVINLDSWYRRNLRLDTINYLNKCLYFIDKNLVEDNVWESQDVHAEFTKQIEIYIDKLTKYLKNSAYDFYINMGDDGLYENRTIYICNQCGIPTVLISHGDPPSCYGFINALRWYYTHLRRILGFKVCLVKPCALNGCKYIFAVRKKQKRYVQWRLIQCKNIYSFGYIYMDNLYSYMNTTRHDANLQSTRSRILFASSDYYSFDRAKHNYLCAFLKKISMSHHITILLKPGENAVPWTDWSYNLKNISVEESKFDSVELYRFIDNFDVVMASNSQILFEAYLLSKKIIHIDIAEKDMFGLVDYGQAFFLQNLDDVKHIFNTLGNFKINHAVREKLIKRNIGYFDGQCSVRVARKVIKILKLRQN